MLITTVVYFISRKFHAGFGLSGERPPLNAGLHCQALIDRYGLDMPFHRWPVPIFDNKCAAAKKIDCRRGPEWYADCKPSTIAF